MPLVEGLAVPGPESRQPLGLACRPGGAEAKPGSADVQLDRDQVALRDRDPKPERVAALELTLELQVPGAAITAASDGDRPFLASLLLEITPSVSWIRWSSPRQVWVLRHSPSTICLVPPSDPKRERPKADLDVHLSGGQGDGLAASLEINSRHRGSASTTVPGGRFSSR